MHSVFDYPPEMDLFFYVLNLKWGFLKIALLKWAIFNIAEIALFQILVTPLWPLSPPSGYTVPIYSMASLVISKKSQVCLRSGFYMSMLTDVRKIHRQQPIYDVSLHAHSE